MLFNSYLFILGFCPITFLVLFLISSSSRTAGRKAGMAWLTLASLFFYGWWNPPYVLLICLSMLVNFIWGKGIEKRVQEKKKAWHLSPKLLLWVAITFNLALLGYYKYMGFFTEQWNFLTGTPSKVEAVFLPLGISFFTFQQISFLVDTYHGRMKNYRFLEYVFVVSFFPHLIAGPIVRHSEIIPEVRRDESFRFSWQNLSFGLTIFTVGLTKKTMIADNLAPIANVLFDSSKLGPVPLFEAWRGVLAYTLQIYFDFSGYSDMAIGLARIAGIRFPINFYSPYQAVNIIEFWRRWHISLSRFLRDYLYIPLGGNRNGTWRRHTNLMITMLLGGLWHGASWNFIIWGGLHGIYLILNHGWRELVGEKESRLPAWTGKLLAHGITFAAVCAAWVFFRAKDLPTARHIVGSLFGSHGVTVGGKYFLLELRNHENLTLILFLLVAFLCPNVYDWMRRYPVTLDSEHSITRELKPYLSWKPSPSWAIACAVVFALAVSFIYRSQVFLYFQF